MEEDFLEKELFFFPTSELTRNMFAAVAVMHRNDQIRASEDREQTEEVEDNYINNLPPDEAAGRTSASPPTAVTEDEKLYAQRRFIAEELYHHLAFLCRSPPAMRGHALPIRQAVAHSVCDILGLPHDEPFLGQLEGEFNDWLNRLGQFTAGWGKIILAEGRQIYLELHPVERSVVAPPRRVFIPRQPDSSERPERGRAVGKGQESD